MQKQEAKQKTVDDTVTDIVKTKRKRDMSNWGQEFIEPGDNRKYLQFAMESMNMPKLDFNNVPSVRERINWYFNRCMECDIKPGVVGMANKELADTIKKAYVLLEEMWENYMQNGKISPPNGIFLGKNNFDYKDVQDVVVTPNNPYDTQSDEELSGKYLTGSVKSE